MELLRLFDRNVIALIQKFPDWLQPVMTVASYIGSPLSGGLALGIIMLWAYLQRSKHLFVSSAVLIAALPAAGIIKIMTGRIRPDTIYVESMRFKTYSFPSWHAYSSALVFGFLAYLALKYLPGLWGPVSAIFLGSSALLVGISRIYLGAHFPTDVVGGWILAAIVLFLVIKYLY